MMERSGAWYRRARTLAVRAGETGELLRSLTGYGALLKELGRMDAARGWYARAERTAKRMGKRRRAAIAYHYSFALAAETGDTGTALDHAARALALYPVHDARLPFLLADFGYLLARLHHYRTAYGILERAGANLNAPADLSLVFSTAARAAGCVGWQERYEQSARAVLKLIQASEEYAPAALVNLAEGARGLRQWERADAYLRRALVIAERRQDEAALRVGREILSAVTRREPAMSNETPALDSPVAVLARSMVARSRRWRRRPPRHRRDY